MKQANGAIVIKGKQRQAFLQAKTKKRMLELIRTLDPAETMNHFNNYWSFIWNDEMKAIGGDQEGLWVGTDMNWHDQNYQKLV